MNAIFDIGADDGFHGILFAFANPKINVFAFEPIMGSKKRILKNLKKVEKFFGIKIKNYKIINVAISDFTGRTTFYQTKYNVASSLLKPKNKLDKFWTSSEDMLIKTIFKGMGIKKKYKVKVLTLEKFCKKNSIKIINYLHIDAQGTDLRVIKSLKNFKKCLIEGVVEIAKTNKLKTYCHEQSFNDLKKKFKKWKFEITKIEEVQKNLPSLNVYFRTNNKRINEQNEIIFNYPAKRLGRLFRRIFSKKINLKDVIFLYLWKLKNII
tara:strand:+ start:81 stop:878 length:798 start_codon:yes stop_codon:yes gene_type:complete